MGGLGGGVCVVDNGGRQGTMCPVLCGVVLITFEPTFARQPFKAQDRPCQREQAETNRKTSKLRLGGRKPGTPCEFAEQKRRCSPTLKMTAVWSQGGVCRLQTEPF